MRIESRRNNNTGVNQQVDSYTGYNNATMTQGVSSNNYGKQEQKSYNGLQICYKWCRIKPSSKLNTDDHMNAEWKQDGDVANANKINME